MGCCGCKKPADDSNEEMKVLEALKSSEEPLKAESIAEMTGIEKDTVSKLITKLKNDGKIISPKRCFYSVEK